MSASWSTDIGRGGMCEANVAENANAPLKCTGGGTISKVAFASYGTPTGSCGSFKVDPSCNSPNSVSVVEGLCLNKASCSIPVSNGGFNGDPCVNVPKRLDVEIECSSQQIGYCFRKWCYHLAEYEIQQF